ncbi:MAG: efflux RND transporter periplasmic adaptor subunit [Verrucomicrobiota bacterium]
MPQPSLDTLSRDRDPTKPPSGRSKAWLLPLGILLGFALIFTLLFRDRLLPATSVQSARVVAIPGESKTPVASSGADAPVIFQATGWVEPDPWAVKATALVDGVIDKVHVLEGELVEKGQAIACLIDDDAKLAVRVAEQELRRRESAREAHCAGILRTAEELKGVQAQVAGAKAVRDAAKDRLERLKRTGSRAVSERDIVDARLDYERVSALLLAAETKVNEIVATTIEQAYETAAMQHTIEAGRVALDQAKLAFDRTEIRAPISGRVLRLMAAPGQKRMLGMDDPDSSTVAILYDPQKLQVRVDVPLADASQLSVGQGVKIRCNLLPDDIFHGKVTSIVGEADIQRNTLQAKVSIDNPVDALRPEMLCRVEFLEAAKGSVAGSRGLVLWVPEEAIDGEQVWVIDPDTNRVEARQIELGSRSDSNREVLSGLRPGEEVVLNPDGLKNRQRVQPERS